MFFNKKADSKSASEVLRADLMPQHIAIIMDGNGRWAKAKGLPRVAGHQRGMEVVKTITKAASDLGVKVLTVYAFSTENWKRPASEVKFLMGLPTKFFDTFVPELIANNVRVNVMGYIDQLPGETQKAVQDAVAQTAQNTGMVLNFALNYGGQAEIVTGIQAIAQQVADGDLQVADINEALVDQNLMTANLSPYQNPDLLIRTSGEERISNFLLWQLAYSEFVFLPQHWPEMTAEALKEAILIYQKRDRRFGGIKEG
ncbi:di-trans-poly-cis-decaprenylcistransferase [Weissella kandleri]|uniref:Isoprenyl transferase n=1 Tax=Weissella kandleri TaxID=1616 RepID=A0A0R2JBV1_9LACO|nr:isoprenyl transferase [Weissella kandleri]KRN74766.1 di-trans-poly-cis-decaprenylcistransferase [Weissella kandleri]